MGRAALLTILIAVSAGAAQAQQKAPTGNPYVDTKNNALRLYVAYGDESACGLGCHEWIAAEGSFDVDSASRFRNFLATLGKTKLPIFFDSSGGHLQSAQTIGRIIRERGLVAGVGKTTPEQCVAQSDPAKCEAAKKSRQKVKADWSSISATCSSACVYALLGAPKRSVPVGSRLGVHATRAVCNGPKGIVDDRDPQCAKRALPIKSQITRYVSEMGVDSKLVEAAYQTPHDRVRYLAREEIVAFGIDRSEPRESAWMVRHSPSPTIMVRFVSESKEAGNISRFGAIQFGCNTSGRFGVVYFRRAFQPEGSDKVFVAAVIDGSKYPLTRGANLIVLSEIEPSALFERYDVLLSPAEVAASRLEIEIRDAKPAAEISQVVIAPSLDGFAHSWKKVSTFCGWKS
jgi:hypothetical protein